MQKRNNKNRPEHIHQEAVEALDDL